MRGWIATVWGGLWLGAILASAPVQAQTLTYPTPGPAKAAPTSVSVPLHSAGAQGTFQADANDGQPSAWVRNESGATFGLVCESASRCQFFLVTDAECAAGGRYPMLVSTAPGAFNATVTCRALAGGRHGYVFEDVRTLGAAMAKGDRVAFAYTVAGGEFRVARFALGGLARVLAGFGEASRPGPAVMEADRSI